MNKHINKQTKNITQEVNKVGDGIESHRYGVCLA